MTLNVDGASFVRRGWTGKIANSATLLIGAESTSGGDQCTGLMDEVVLRAG